MKAMSEFVLPLALVMMPDWVSEVIREQSPRIGVRFALRGIDFIDWPAANAAAGRKAMESKRG